MGAFSIYHWLVVLLVVVLVVWLIVVLPLRIISACSANRKKGADHEHSAHQD